MLFVFPELTEGEYAAVLLTDVCVGCVVGCVVDSGIKGVRFRDI